MTIDEKYDLQLDSYSRVLGELLRTIIFDNNPSYHKNNRLKSYNLSKEDLARIFSNIAVNFSTNDVDYLELCKKTIPGVSDE